MITTAKQLRDHLNENPPREWERVSTKLLAELVAIAEAGKALVDYWKEHHPILLRAELGLPFGRAVAAYFAPPEPRK